MDEMNIEEVAELDIQDDCIYGPYKKMLVFLARGLGEDWKQILYKKNDQTSGGYCCEEHRVVIKGLVFDNGNPTLLSELGVSGEELNHSMSNPSYAGKCIYYFPTHQIASS